MLVAMEDDDPVDGGDLGWMGTKEAAARLGVQPRTLYAFIDKGDFPAYKFGRVIRLQRGDVDAFIEASRVEPGTLQHLVNRGGSEG